MIPNNQQTLDKINVLIHWYSFFIILNIINPSNSKDNINLRIKNAYSEIFHAKKYDHILINDDFEECCKNLVSIILGENNFPFDDAKEMFLKKLLY